MLTEYEFIEFVPKEKLDEFKKRLKMINYFNAETKEKLKKNKKDNQWGYNQTIFWVLGENPKRLEQHS